MSISNIIDSSYARLEQQLVQIAEQMPAERYSFKPVQHVRSFGEQLRHIGAVQYVVGAALLDERPPADVGDGDSGPRSMTAKSEIVRYALDSFAYIRRAIRSIDESNAFATIPHPYDPANSKIERLSLALGYACHGWEHYGQMVVYRRLTGGVPLTPV